MDIDLLILPYFSNMFDRCFKTLKTLSSSQHEYMNVLKQRCVPCVQLIESS